MSKTREQELVITIPLRRLYQSPKPGTWTAKHIPLHYGDMALRLQDEDGSAGYVAPTTSNSLKVQADIVGVPDSHHLHAYTLQYADIWNAIMDAIGQPERKIDTDELDK